MNDRAAQNALARAWADDQGPTFIGRPLIEAEAAAVAAGLHTKVVQADGWTTMEFGIGRVRIAVDDRERVTGVSAG